MPADKFTKKADTPKKKRQWSHVYENALARGLPEGTAIREASGIIKRAGASKRGK